MLRGLGSGEFVSKFVQFVNNVPNYTRKGVRLKV
jgi:hypothetical protein